MKIKFLAMVFVIAYADVTRANSVEDYKKACDVGDAGACFDLGVLYNNGKGVKQDFLTASKLYIKACNSGSDKGCYAINSITCFSGVAFGCNNLGTNYEHGQGVKQDYFTAADLYQKACDGGDAQGCYNLAIMYGTGKGVRQSTQKALDLFGQSCDMRNQNGCDAYAKLKNSDK